MDDVKDKLDELVEQSDYFVASPETIEGMRKKGLPIKSTFTTYQEYLDKLFSEKREIAEELIGKLPHLGEGVANSTIESLYNELRECFVLGIPGAAITLAVIFLELSLKYRLYEEQIKNNQKASWNGIENLDFRETVSELKEKDVITPEEKIKLDKFCSKVRNNYIHYNIKKLIRDMFIEQLPSVNIETGEITIHRNVKASEHSYLWFSAKKVLDNKTVVPLVAFSISWVNKLLEKPREETAKNPLDN